MYEVCNVNASIFIMALRQNSTPFPLNGYEGMTLCCSGVIASQMERFNIHKQDPRCDLTAANHVSLFKLNIWCMRHLWKEPGRVYAKSYCNSGKIYIVICIKDGAEIFICNFTVLHEVSNIYSKKTLRSCLFKDVIFNSI